MSYDNIFKPETKKVLNIGVLIVSILFTLVCVYNAGNYIIEFITRVFDGYFDFTFINILQTLFNIIHYVGYLLIVWGFVGSLLLKNRNFRLVSILGLIAILVVSLIYYFVIFINSMENGFFSRFIELAMGYIFEYFLPLILVLLLILVGGNTEKEK